VAFVSGGFFSRCILRVPLQWKVKNMIEHVAFELEGFYIDVAAVTRFI